MAESCIKRFKIDAKYQRELIIGGLAIRREGIADASKNLNISERTLRDWIRGKFTVTDNGFNYFLCGRNKFKEYAKSIDKYWYVKKGARLGGLAKYKKYGYVSENEDKRITGWRKWWQREGFKKYNFIGKTKSFKLPRLDEQLSELTGIILGDGGLSKYQLVVTLNSEDDREYKNYVSRLINKKFGVKPKEYFDKKARAVNLVVSRKLLIDYLVGKIGLVRGNKTKNQISVPEWITDSPTLSKKCVRGLIDTDGSVVIHRYDVNKKTYSYRKIDFVSASKPLVDFVFLTLLDSGIKARMFKDRHVWIDSIESVKKYFDIIGSSNPKHLMRANK